MARLSLHPATSAAGDPRDAERRALAEHAASASGALDRREVTEWRAEFERTSEIKDVHDRYMVRVYLIEELLGCADLDPHDCAAFFTAAAHGVVGFLEENPFEPTLLNWAGVLLYELDRLKPAKALFEAAQRLDADRSEPARNLRAIKARRGQGPSAVRHFLSRKDALSLTDISERARRVARRAQPRTDQSVTLCMIVKNEEEMLPRTLAAAIEWVDEVIIADTGSTDRTVEIAEAFGATVVSFPWTGSFADARNAAWDHATMDWVFYLDADEVLMEGHGERLRKLIGHTWREAMSLELVSLTCDVEAGTSTSSRMIRLIKNLPHYRWEGRLHEQVTDSLPGIPERISHPDLCAEHYGYLPDVIDARDKSMRNIELLNQVFAAGKADAFDYFNLGREYLGIDEDERGLEYLLQSKAMIDAEPDGRDRPFRPALLRTTLLALVALGRTDDAVAWAEDGLLEFPLFSDLLYFAAVGLCEAQRHVEAESMLRRAIDMGDAPAGLEGSTGAGTYRAQLLLAECLAAREDFDGAVEALRASLRDKPGFPAALGYLTAALFDSGVSAEDVEQELVTEADELSSQALFAVAVPLYERGEVEVAERLIRQSLAKRPDVDRIRLALVEALLSRSAWSEAIETARMIAVDSSWSARNARSYVFAAILHDADAPSVPAVPEALDYARSAGLAAPELALFEAWSRGTASAPIPAEALLLLDVMLKALLRVEEFDQFGRLAVVGESLDVGWREYREFMARFYLNHGFLDSAADEWATVIQSMGPDRRSLQGMALIASERGLDEEAALFAAEATRCAG